MILTKFSSNTLIRACAVVSMLIGLLYTPSIFNMSLPIVGLGPELTEGQKMAELWGLYAVYGGLGIFLGSFSLNASLTTFGKRLVLSIALISMFLLIVAQFPPLFWWIFVGGAVFSWSSVIGFFLHLFLLFLSIWGTVVIIHSIERLRRS